VKIEIKTLFKWLFLIILVLVFSTGATSADLFVTKIASGNQLKTTTLDISQRDTATNVPSSVLFNISGLIPSGFKVETVRFKKDGKMGSKYHLSTIQTSGDNQLCNALQLMALQNWQAVRYQGKLLDFVQDSVIGESGFDDWIFSLSLSNNEVSITNKVCDFNLIFSTYRNDPSDHSGFYDEEVLTNHITSGTWAP